MIRCWPIFNKTPAVKTASHPLVTAHLAYRRKRRLRRAIAITCISIGSAGAAIALPPVLYPPPLSPHPPAVESSGNALPESQWVPETATGAPTPIPEPSSLALLAGAVAAMIWRLRA